MGTRPACARGGTDAHTEKEPMGKQPFGWAGVAWDGANLWVIDAVNKRICMIEKTDPG